MAMHPLGRVGAVSASAAPVSATARRQDAEEQLVYVGDARHGGVLVAHADPTKNTINTHDSAKTNALHALS